MNRNIYARFVVGLVMVGSMSLIAACAAQTDMQASNCHKVAQKADFDVAIPFNEKGCPGLPDKDNFEIDRDKRIVWRAVDASGKLLDTQQFEIYFDPFKGDPLKTRNGELKSNPFDSCSPKGEYKYTIVGAGCEGDPRDPRFRLR